MKKQKRKIKLYYVPYKENKKKNLIKGGVADPKYIDELHWELMCNSFEEKNKTVKIKGSKRAVWELGKYFMNIGYYDTLDEKYHEHLDDLLGTNSSAIINMTISYDE